MPATTKTTHPRDPNLVLTFTEAEHSYIDSTGKRYTSVTTIVHDQFEKFDAEKMAGYLAPSRGVTPEQLLNEWERKKNEACDYGTRCHEFAEFCLTNGESGATHEPANKKETIAQECILNAVGCLLRDFELIKCEQVLFSPSIAIAGTCDLLMRSREGKILVLDWKTNERLTTEHWNMGLGVCSGLTNCNMTHYGLQLSIYEQLLRMEGHIGAYDEVERALIWIEPYSQHPLWKPLHRYPEARQILGESLVA
jgi:ATP-dependent exoDNAse (exonuclease V) beta subunit